ncbi:MAG: DUF3192 domain-containing protein [Candidatus Omnitrophica bacterium]|nr:DUF3192 domain-containing protein [Candidatus Omnitrophota bacterium]
MTKNFLTIALCLTLLGCADTANQVKKPFSQPQLGMTKQQLIAALGKPEAVEIYQKSDKTRVEFDIYLRTYQSFSQKVPVCLIDNKVVGWGKTFYEDHVSMEDTRIK